MQTLLRDIRYCLRMLRKNPGFTTIAVLTLALGIGANTAVFSVVNTLLLRALPYPQAEQIVYVWTADSKNPTGTSSMAPLNYDDLRRGSQSFEGYSAFRYTSYALTGDGSPEAISGVAISGDFGRVVNVAPILGRVFSNAEDVAGKDRVIVISHGLWQRRFAGNQNIIGQIVQLNGEPTEIIGVMPPQFGFPSSNVDAWKPLALDAAKIPRGSSFLQTVARLKNGVSVETARAEANSIAAQIVRANAKDVSDLVFNLVLLRKQLVGDIEKPVLILFGAVVLVLLIACVNVANLILGRATVRWKEVALRAALGASRWSLMRLLLMESLILSLVGGGLGLALAGFGIDAMLKLNPDALPRSKSIGIDGFVIAFTLGMSCLTGILFGLIPALHISKADLNQTLRENSRTASGAGGLKFLRNSLVVTEIGLSLVLLISAGLLLKSFWNLLQVNPGFRAENVVTTQINLPRARYQDEWQRAEFFRATLASVRALPGVQYASATTNLPFNNSRGATSFSIDGRPEPPNSDSPQADEHAIFPDYFRAMSISMKSGRDFTEADDRTRPGVIIINERLAQKYFPTENPLGKHITVGSPEEGKLYGKAVSREIVGVIGNIKLLDLDAEFQPEVYLPAQQMPEAGMALAVRGNVPAEQLINGLRKAVESVDPQIPIRNARLLETAVKNSLAPQRFIAGLLFVFAGIALVLALIGIYGVMSYTVTQRTQEIGIRMALGAQSSDVLKLILSQGGSLIGIGLATGLLVSYFVTRLLKSLLFEVPPLDISIFTSVVALLAIVALLACWLPARRAAKVDPMIALRCD